MSHAMVMLRHENAILCHGTYQSLDKDLKLQVVYHHLSEAKHGWNYAH
jgi:hypothetical protein